MKNGHILCPNWLSGHRKSRFSDGLGGVQRSVMMGDMLIYEADSGILKAVMDAEYITTLRTGAVAAHSALRKERF